MEPMNVEQVFDDATLMAEFSIREKLQTALQDRQALMAFLAVLIKREGGELTIFDSEMINTCKFYFGRNNINNAFVLTVEDATVEELQEEGLLEETDE
jgi:hypothetical protein